MKVRPVRIDGRIRFRALNPENGVSPGTVTLDPRSDETQENLPRTTTHHSLKAEAVVTTVEPAAVSPVVEVEEEVADAAFKAETEEKPKPAEGDKSVQVGT
jgi:hypothetical protein